MNLRYIILFPEHTLSDSFGSIFRNRLNANINFIRNYLSKEVRKLKIDSGNFNTLSIELNPAEEACTCVDKTLVISMKFTDLDYDKLIHISKLEMRYEFYLSLFVKGYKMAIDRGYNLPLSKLLQLHEQFRKANYKNSWVWKTKVIKAIEKKIIFSCEFTTFDFTFNLKLYDLKGNLKSQKCLMRTPPFEICYEYDFKKIVFTEEKIIILDYLDHPSFEIDIQRLQYNEIEFKQLNFIVKIQKKNEENLKNYFW